MIKIVIIEDEIPARKKIKKFLEGINSQTFVLAEIDNVTTAIEFLKSTSVDLIFSDIELLDGNAFDIYKQTPITCPIIFTTAYDQFWMDAFDNNGIAYLLKPFSKERFQKAWDKFVMLRNTSNDINNLISNFTKIIEEKFTNNSFKKRFVIQNNQGIYFLDVENISFFAANEGVVFANDILGKKHLLRESTLKEIEEKLNPTDFYRINRSEIINKEHVEKIERYNKNTLALKIKGNLSYLKTSQSNTAIFREWIDK